MAVRLRAHHVLCSVGFVGEGYDDAFTENMAHIVNGQLRGHGGRDIDVMITAIADSICAPCPRRIGLGCEAQAAVDGLDARHGTALGIAPGDRLSWGACLERVAERIAPDDLDTLCTGCRWLPMGACKAAVAELRQQTVRATG